jgi:gamma-glutamyl:cysteine ligase YbdK (ATP-grasp superfamily)
VSAEAAPLHLFEAYGVELEYALVDRESLAALPVADRLLAAAAGAPAAEVTRGDLGWSNELVLHVIELKTAAPAPALPGLAARFDRGVRAAEEIAGALEPAPGARLMPGAMHPWFDPATETRLWPHEGAEIYRAYDRIFGTRGHGWSNLQAVHLNLPFAGDEEFARLHAAIRLVLPILPALAASSPIVEGRVTGLVDSRLEAYRTNSRRFASITGQVIPEPVYTRADYEERILQPIYRDLEPLDPEGVLRHEFVNARGAIARFSRGSIEIRLIDVQEAPRADLAVLAAVVGVLKLLVRDAWSLQEAQRAVPVEPLHALLSAGIAAGEHAEIVDDAYLALFGYRHRGGKGRGATTAGDLWRHLVERSAAAGTLDEATFGADLQAILDQGPLARRILHALGTDAEADRGMEIPRRYLREVWDGLCDCLGRGERFTP